MFTLYRFGTIQRIDVPKRFIHCIAILPVRKRCPKFGAIIQEQFGLDRSRIESEPVEEIGTFEICAGMGNCYSTTKSGKMPALKTYQLYFLQSKEKKE